MKMYVPIFYFYFFDILKYIKYVFQNIESICSQEPKLCKIVWYMSKFVCRTKDKTRK
jgi:hypothetical protein